MSLPPLSNDSLSQEPPERTPTGPTEQTRQAPTQPVAAPPQPVEAVSDLANGPSASAWVAPQPTPWTAPAQPSPPSWPGSVATGDQAAYARGYPVATMPAQDPVTAATKQAKSAMAWAIGALVASVAALLLALGALVATLVVAADTRTQVASAEQNTTVPDDTMTSSGVNGYPVRGAIDGFQPGSELTGTRVEDAVRAALVKGGATVTTIACPTSPTAGVSSVIACSGAYDDIDDWTIVVYVLDERGSILVTSY